MALSIPLGPSEGISQPRVNDSGGQDPNWIELDLSPHTGKGARDATMVYINLQFVRNFHSANNFQ